MEIFNGKEYTRVSQVLDAFGGYDCVPEYYLMKAQDRGDIIHAYIANDILGNTNFTLSDAFKGYIDSYKQFPLVQEVIAVEQRFYDNIFMLTGKADLVVRDKDGKFGLYDWKTSAKESKLWRLQGSAYAWLCPYPIDWIKYVKLDAKGGEPTVYEYKKDVDGFFKCLYVYKLFFEKPRVFVYDD